MRTFIAVRIPATHAIEQTLRQLATMQPPLRLVAPHQCHVTLAFLGDTDTRLFPELATILREVAATESVQQLSLKGLGVFPRMASPRVVWAGFESPDPLHRMASLLAERCERLGFAREDRPFHPHVTLARVKLAVPAPLADFVRQRATTDLGTVTVSGLVLFRSEPRQSGLEYTEMAAAPFGMRAS